MLPINTILWPTDASEPALAALDTAIELAEHFGAGIYALQVINQVPVLTEAGFAGAPATFSNFNTVLYEKELEEQAKIFLNRTVAEKVPGAVQVETHVVFGEAKNTIVDFAERNNVDLIVMATSGKTGFAHFMIGSVAESTIRKSSIPTLVIPSPEKGGDE